MRNVKKAKNRFIKYTKAELEGYINDAESCVKKINSTEIIRFSPLALVNFQKAIMDEMSFKIGRLDRKLEGIVLDFRNTKVKTTQSEIRQDSLYSAIEVETNFYVFKPKADSVVSGVVKFVNRMAMETVITVLIYRVFNVKITMKGLLKYKLEKNQEIKIRVKNFHFENVIPYIEGDIIDLESMPKLTQSKHAERMSDSGVSITSEAPASSEVKHERFLTDDDSEDDEVDKQSEYDPASFTSIAETFSSSTKIQKRKLNFNDSTEGIGGRNVNDEDDKESVYDPATFSPLKGNSTSKSKNKKRKMNFDADIEEILNPASKKIKIEPLSDTEEVSTPSKKIKKEKDSSSQSTHTGDKELDELLGFSKVKSKKKKPKKSSDFEKSLQKILNSV